MTDRAAPRPTTFRDVLPEPRCPQCSKAPVSTVPSPARAMGGGGAVASTDTKTILYTCPEGHTWEGRERVVRG